MTAIEIIEEIKRLPEAEKDKVIDAVKQLPVYKAIVKKRKMQHLEQNL